MEDFVKEKLVYRIISGTVRCHINNDIFLVKSLDNYCKYIAQERFESAYNDAINDGLYDEDELEEFLYDNNIWSEQLENKFLTIQKDLDELKMKYFKLKFKSNEKQIVKQAIQRAKTEINSLYSTKHSYDQHSARGFATGVKLKYCIGMSIYMPDGSKLFANDATYDNYTGDLINKVLLFLQENVIVESDYREIARTEPWRIIWNNKKATKLWDTSSVNLNEEQKTLCTWSLIYDNVYESHEAPNTEAINDDDALDGWFIVQRKKREVEQLKQEHDNIINDPRLAKADEVYIPVNTLQDAQKLDMLNSEQSKKIKQQRFKKITQKGGVAQELELPDVNQKLQMAINQRYKGRTNG